MTFRTRDDAISLDPKLIEEYRGVPTSVVSDALMRLRGVVGLYPYHGKAPLLGPAFTVRTREGDNKAIHEAIEVARVGDVIVVDGGGDVSRALIGEIVVHKAIARGIAGFVIDGAIRDAQAIEDLGFPCFARSVAHRGPYKEGPAYLNEPIAVGGEVIFPGDLIIGDRDGVVAVPASKVADVLPAVRKKIEDEARKIDAIKNRKI